MAEISLAEDLEELRKALLGCRLAAYADLSARMVLRISADPKPRQEEIDALCVLAAQCLDSPSLPAFFDGEAPYTAMVAGAIETQFFIRSLNDPTDALILIVAEPVAQTSVWAAAQTVLDSQAEGQAAP